MRWHVIEGAMDGWVCDELVEACEFERAVMRSHAVVPNVDYLRPVVRGMLSAAPLLGEELAGLDFKPSPLQARVLRYSEGDGAPWHHDLHAGMTPPLSLSATLLLSDPGSFSGGEFEFWAGGSSAAGARADSEGGPSGLTAGTRSCCPALRKGDLLIFPSRQRHRVRKVAGGTRFVLTAFWRAAP